MIEECGILLEPQSGMTTAELVETARYLESRGFGYVFRSDHLLPFGGRTGIDAPECWSSLGAIAASTTKVKFGPLVSPVGFRNPVMLAKMACTLHSFSGGRALLGMGAGWFKDEYLAYGYEFPSFRVRRAQFLEALKVTSVLAEGRRVDFDGEYFKVHTECTPKPAGKVHLIVGGKNDAILRAVGRYADEWNVFGMGKEEFLKKAELVRSTAARGDRKVQVSRVTSLTIAETREKLDALLGARMKAMGQSGTLEEYKARLGSMGTIVGLVEDYVQQVRAIREWGVDRFYFQWMNVRDREPVELLVQALKRA